MDPSNIKIDEKWYETIFIYYFRYVPVKDSKYVNIDSVNPLYLIFSNVNGYFEEINKSKYLTLVSTNETKKKKENEELRIKIRDLIRSLTKISDNNDEKYIKTNWIQMMSYL